MRVRVRPLGVAYSMPSGPLGTASPVTALQAHPDVVGTRVLAVVALVESQRRSLEQLPHTSQVDRPPAMDASCGIPCGAPIVGDVWTLTGRVGHIFGGILLVLFLFPCHSVP